MYDSVTIVSGSIDDHLTLEYVRSYLMDCRGDDMQHVDVRVVRNVIIGQYLAHSSGDIFSLFDGAVHFLSSTLNKNITLFATSKCGWRVANIKDGANCIYTWLLPNGEEQATKWISVPIDSVNYI